MGCVRGVGFFTTKDMQTPLPSPPPPPRGPECASMNGFPMHVGRVRRVHNTQKKSFLHFSRNVKMKEFSMWGERGGVGVQNTLPITDLSCMVWGVRGVQYTQKKISLIFPEMEK